MNDQPRRLCCMIMDCKPRSADVVETVDIAQNTAKAVASRDTGHRSKLRLSNGTTRIELEIPEAASLVFPELDSMSAGEKKNASKEAGTFLAEYFDRRAQANFVRLSILSQTFFRFLLQDSSQLFTGPRKSQLEAQHISS